MATAIQRPIPPSVFISYSWDDARHRKWVRSFAEKLHRDGVQVALDQWALAPGDQLPKFMETVVRENDYVLVICTPKYKAKSDMRAGGVGYEGDIMTGEVFALGKRRSSFRCSEMATGKLPHPPGSRGRTTWICGVGGTLRRATRTCCERCTGDEPSPRRWAVPPKAIAPSGLRSILAEVFVGWSGGISMMEEWYAPLWKGMIKSLRRSGMGRAVDIQGRPPDEHGAPDFPNTRSAGSFDFVLDANINSETVAVVCDELFQLHIRPFLTPVRQLFETEYEKEHIRLGLRLVTRYKNDPLTVIVDSHFCSAKEVGAAVELIPEAQWKALNWVETRGLTSERLLLSIKAGHLSSLPRLA